jgi:HPt (histidine-containing phosphotransfer) domain-containing protein
MRCAWYSNTGFRWRSNVDLPILDRDRLKLITRGNGKLAGEFLGALFDEADQLLARLGVLLRSDDRIAVADAAHTLKGMAAELGTMRLRAAAAGLEMETEISRWPEHVESVRGALAELRSAIDDIKNV